MDWCKIGAPTSFSIVLVFTGFSLMNLNTDLITLENDMSFLRKKFFFYGNDGLSHTVTFKRHCYLAGKFPVTGKRKSNEKEKQKGERTPQSSYCLKSTFVFGYVIISGFVKCY
jgi:hypothetical protein